MVYMPRTWATGQTLTAPNFNDVELGLGNASGVAGVSIAAYLPSSPTASAVNAILATLLANEPVVTVPPGAWPINPSSPFAFRAGQVLRGVNSGRHGIDPGAGMLSRFTVPAGFNGVDIFEGPVGAAHVSIQDILIDLSAANVANTGNGLTIDPAGTGEEAQWNLTRFQVFGPFNIGISVGTNRRAVMFNDCRVFRGNSTVIGTGILANGTDCYLIRPIVSGGINGHYSQDGWVGIKAYAGMTRIFGGDIFGCGTGISTSNTNSDGIYIGGGLSIDRSYTQAIYLSPGSGGVISGVVLHSNSQQADNGNPHIKCDSPGGWVIDDLEVFAESGFPNQAKSVITFGTGGYARIGSNIRVKGGVGASGGVRTSISVGIANADTTYAVSPVIDPALALMKNDSWRMTLTGDIMPSVPTTGFDGQDLYLFVTQDAVGGRLLIWGSEVVNSPSIDLLPLSITVVHLKFQSALGKWVCISPSNTATPRSIKRYDLGTVTPATGYEVAPVGTSGTFNNNANASIALEYRTGIYGNPLYIPLPLEAGKWQVDVGFNEDNFAYNQTGSRIYDIRFTTTSGTIYVAAGVDPVALAAAPDTATLRNTVLHKTFIVNVPDDNGVILEAPASADNAYFAMVVCIPVGDAATLSPPVPPTVTNQPPTAISISASTVASGASVGTVVGNLSATDPDVGNTFTYTLVSGTGSTDNAAFTIVGSQVRTAAATGSAGSRSIRVQVSDGTATFAQAITLTVTAAGPKPFAQVWSAYTENGSGGLHVQDTHATFETFLGKVSNEVITMADIRQFGNEGGIYITYAASQNGGYHQWTPGNKGSRKFLLTWPLCWHSDTDAGGTRTTDQNLVDALADSSMITEINKVCDSYLIPVFGNGTGLIIRILHEWELDFYPWGLTRNVNNTTARMISQTNRLIAAFKAKMPNLKFHACSIAGAGSAARYTVLDGVRANLHGITADIYDTGTMSTQYSDIVTLFNYATTNGLDVGITETGIQSRGDNGQFIRDLWNVVKPYGQAIDHVAWFNSAQGGASRFLESNPNSKAAVLDLIANF